MKSHWFIRVLQGLIAVLPVGIFCWLVWMNLVPSGVFVTERSVHGQSAFIERVLPDTRVREPYVDASGDWVQSIVGDPAFFFVHPHRRFDMVQAEVWFKNETVPIVEFGALAQNVGEVYDLHPLQNLLIDHSSWNRLEQDGFVLLQRDPVYESIDAFRKHPPAREQIATYHYALETPFRLSTYNPSNEKQTIDVSLRGFHEFYTYIKNETLHFDIRYMDMNRTNGDDSLRVVVLNEAGQSVGEVRALDDGNTGDNSRPSALKTLTLDILHLPEGVYKVQLQAEHDIFFRSIITSQQKMVFLNQLYLADEVGYQETPRPVSFWTEGKHLQFVTQHADAVQDVQVGKTIISVTKPYEEYRTVLDELGVLSGHIPKGDMIIRGDGLFAFAPEQYFRPDPVRLRADTDLDRQGIDFIMAKYKAPKKEGNWFVVDVKMDASILSFQDETWKFVFSLPGIDASTQEFLLGGVRLTLQRPVLTWEKMKQEIKERL